MGELIKEDAMQSTSSEHCRQARNACRKSVAGTHDDSACGKCLSVATLGMEGGAPPGIFPLLRRVSLTATSNRLRVAVLFGGRSAEHDVSVL
jgi:hypothetical protein